MKSKPFLELADVKAVAQAAEAEALKNQWAVSIAVVDDGGHLLWLQRLDGAPAISAQIAPAKAQTAALGRRESRIYEEIINGGRVESVRAYGLSDAGSGTPADTTTLFQAGSVSKPVAAIAALRLWERGRLDLDKGRI